MNMASESENSRSSFDEAAACLHESGVEFGCNKENRLTNSLDVGGVGTGGHSSKLLQQYMSEEVVVQHYAQQHCSVNFCDGSDSGVETAAGPPSNGSFNNNISNNNSSTVAVALQRAPSCSSSTCGDAGYHNGQLSCDSSVHSYNSDAGEARAAASHNASTTHCTSAPTTGSISGAVMPCECCSENGSESSSVTGMPPGSSYFSNVSAGFSVVKKKVAMFESPQSSSVHSGRFGKEKNQHSHGTVAGTAQPVSLGASFNGDSSMRARPKTISLSRTASLHRYSGSASLLQNAEHARTRDKSLVTIELATTPNKSAATSSLRHSKSLRVTRPQKPDSLPATLNSNPQPRTMQRTPSLSRARTPGTPSDDGRWPSSLINRSSALSHARRGLSATPDLANVRLRSNMLSLDANAKCSSSNLYGTLPRRRKQKSVEDLTTGRCSSRSSSTSRDPVTSNPRLAASAMLSSRLSLANSYSTPTKMLPPPCIMTSSVNSLSVGKTPSTSRKPKPLQQRTRIFHETSCQTAITSEDMQKLLDGVRHTAPQLLAIDALEFQDKQTQSDLRDRELEQLHGELRQLSQREHELLGKLNECTQHVAQLELQLQIEHQEKLTMQQELQLNTERVIGILELARVNSDTPTKDLGRQCDSLLMLESQIQVSSNELLERNAKIGKLESMCRKLEAEMQRSALAREHLLKEKLAMEKESNELQDFIEYEKAAMLDSYNELEQEYHACKRQLDSKTDEIKVLRDECRHLVRLNEQRRQENRLMHTKYAGLESRSKELVAQLNNSVSGASTSLTGLQTRLDSLVEQLISTYNISESDLEDTCFQKELIISSTSAGNETGHSSCTVYNNAPDYECHCHANIGNMPTNAISTHTKSNCKQAQHAVSDDALSPQRNQSFIAAVISAIRNATTPSNKRMQERHRNYKTQEQATMIAEDESDSTTEMLDSETEPCLMMDNVLEDVSMPDSHSHNLVSSTFNTMENGISQNDSTSELVTAAGDESLQNLSQAIANRQQMELQFKTLTTAQKLVLPFGNSQQDISVSEDISYHDSVAEMPSLAADYSSAHTLMEQVIEVENLVTKLLKVLRLIQMDNDNCIQQLILDKNKLQQNKEDMLEKLKEVQDELMDATQELVIKKNDLSSSKAEVQRQCNEIDRLTENVAMLSMPNRNGDNVGEATKNTRGILNLLKMWHQKGQFRDTSVRDYLLGVLLHTTAVTQECNANDATEGSNMEDVLHMQLKHWVTQTTSTTTVMPGVTTTFTLQHEVSMHDSDVFDQMNANEVVNTMKSGDTGAEST